MHVKTRNVNEAFYTLVNLLHHEHVPTIRMPSRVGEVVMINEPMTITYERPKERVLLNEGRDANPFFHLFESIWMLAGSEDVASVAVYNKRMREFSDDGVTFHGAYGYRWREQFGYDQLNCIIKELKDNPLSRRCVLQMWDATCENPTHGDDKRHDLYTATNGGKDVPCNLSAVFQRTDQGALNMTVFNRSNDLIWGALGANAVHFSYLQEYIANCVGCDVGVYNQISANLHYYTERWTPVEFINGHATCKLPTCPIPLVTGNKDRFDDECKQLVTGGINCGYLVEPYLQRVVLPMMLAFHHHKNRDYKLAHEAIGYVVDEHWQLAGNLWLYKREKLWREKNDVPTNPYLSRELRRQAKASADKA